MRKCETKNEDIVVRDMTEIVINSHQSVFRLSNQLHISTGYKILK